MRCGMRVFLAAAWLGASVVFAADGPSKAALSPADADADFQYQGEYAGEITVDGTTAKYGVQIIAKGNGKFRAVGYPGGLPGDGFLGGEKIEVDGELKGDGVEFDHDNIHSVVKNGAITIFADGQQAAKFDKVDRKSPTLGMKPPAGAKVLFNGTSADAFENGKVDPNGLLIQGVTSKDKFQSATLHLEFLLSYMPTATGQGRANSGCYLQGRYEVQILDSFGLEGKNNECGGIYTIRDPQVNMCYPPLSWQTYDIDFTAAKYDAEGKKTADAKITVKHNGEVIHRDVPLPKGTTAAPVAEGPQPGPLYLQDHGNPIRFRNIWIVEK